MYTKYDKLSFPDNYTLKLSIYKKNMILVDETKHNST